MTFSMSLDGTPGARVLARISASHGYRGGPRKPDEEQEIEGTLPLHLTVEGSLVAVTAWLIEDTGELTVSISGAGSHRTAHTRPGQPPATLVITAPRRPPQSFETNRSKRQR